MFGGLYKSIVGKNVEIYASSQCEHSLFVESGKVSNILTGQGENAVFIELDNGTIINVRYIVKIIVK